MPPVAPGTHWRRKRNTGHSWANEVVLVLKAPAGKVTLQRPDGVRWDMPIQIFLGVYSPDPDEDRRNKTGVCERCGSADLRQPTDKYCRACIKLIASANVARRKREEEQVLTTTSARVIEERQVEPKPADQISTSFPPAAAAGAVVSVKGRWRITGRRWVEETIEVEGESALEALAAADQAGLIVTDVHMLGT